jgi:BirA family transcriptional regulator, biotin operon repressor / biotin---[acetyl-CoA-carboxylase] ligase
MDSAAPFTVLDTVDSTNNYAMAAVQQGTASHGMAWFALEQTAGKGQRGKSWVSEKGKNIALSIVLQPGLVRISSQFHLSAAVAVSCFDLVNSYAGEETRIKWPNDIYWRDRKAGGILIENVLQGSNWKWAVAGIGINVNQTSFEKFLVNPVSLKQVTGKEHDAVEMGKELHTQIMKNLAVKEPFNKVMEKYHEHLFMKNKTVWLKKDGVRFETVIKEVSPAGRLITVDAIEREFEFGEVEWVLG